MAVWSARTTLVTRKWVAKLGGKGGADHSFFKEEYSCVAHGGRGVHGLERTGGSGGAGTRRTNMEATGSIPCLVAYSQRQTTDGAPASHFFQK